MAASAAPEHVLSRASARIAELMGLHFPSERWDDLERGLARVATELGLADAAACGDWLSSATLTKAQQQVLARQLTVGETYFFREPKTFDVLTNRVLPELIRTRHGEERRLRVWSAACCTGEEPYSLAICLSQAIPDFAEWHVTILATDLNEQFLRKAAAGVYGEWSFRQAPPGFKERYFRRTAEGRYQIVPAIRRRVTFAQLNLVEDVFPSLATDTNAMDLVFCRNVLMYFTPAQVRKVIGNLHRSLVDGGWLAVSPSEVSQALFPDFETVNFPGVILYRRGGAHHHVEAARRNEPPSPVEFSAPAPQFSGNVPSVEPGPALTVEEFPAPPPPPPESVPDLARHLSREGRFAEAAEVLLSASSPPGSVQEYELLARALANQGELREALAWCDRWLGADKLDAAGHYLRAMVLQDLGEGEKARLALQKTMYLQPDLVLAHFAMGNLSRAGGSVAEADRHFQNALKLLRTLPANEPLPESDGLTAGRLAEIITSLLNMDAIP